MVLKLQEGTYSSQGGERLTLASSTEDTLEIVMEVIQ